MGTLLAVVGLAAACVALLGTARGAVIGCVACPVTFLGLRRLQQRPIPLMPDPSLPLALDLAAAALRSGRPLASALDLAARCVRTDTAHTMRKVSELLRLGADPRQAWSAAGIQGPLHSVGAVAVRSAASGIKLAAAFEQLATDLRAARVAAGQIRAHRAGVLAMAPLAGCFLPSFVCLGVVPVVVGIARTALGVLPGGP